MEDRLKNSIVLLDHFFENTPKEEIQALFDERITFTTEGPTLGEFMKQYADALPIQQH